MHAPQESPSLALAFSLPPHFEVDILIKDMIMTAAASKSVHFSGAFRFPGKKQEGVTAAPLSERALAIAKAREELIGLLHDVPESDHELSFTDLIEKGLTADGSVPSEAPPPAGDPNQASEVKKRVMNKNSRSSRSTRSNEGVLLNMYMPASFTRSLTVSRPSRGAGHGAPVDSNKRDRESTAFGCWSAIWERGRGKWRKQLEREG